MRMREVESNKFSMDANINDMNGSQHKREGFSQNESHTNTRVKRPGVFATVCVAGFLVNQHAS